ncbi:putative HTH-type transcriptional regulator TtgW [Burkholderiales bacterium]|nr:putative HTH-type transcriptional regulator TtgW [Burkholderiales bacterium]
MSHPGEPEVFDSRQRLIQAAAEAFMEEGYRASIDRIAARAGVARQTVYNHFTSKDDLFSEVAHAAAGAILVSLDGDGGDLRERLLRFGTALRQRVIGDEGLAMFRTLSAEAPRFPALAQAFFDKGPGQAVRRLADFLVRAMNEGTLRRDEPLFAAEMLLSMLESFDRTRRLFGAPSLPADQEQDRVARIVDSFLRAYAPEH